MIEWFSKFPYYSFKDLLFSFCSNILSNDLKRKQIRYARLSGVFVYLVSQPIRFEGVKIYALFINFQ